MVMDQDTTAIIADIKQQLRQLRVALGDGDPANAETLIGEIITTVEGLGTNTTQSITAVQAEVTALTVTAGQLFTAINAIEAQVQSLINWAVTVTPPFRG